MANTNMKPAQPAQPANPQKRKIIIFSGMQLETPLLDKHVRLETPVHNAEPQLLDLQNLHFSSSIFQIG